MELVIFDMDGIIIDTEPVSKEGWARALKYQGFGMEEAFFVQMLGRSVLVNEGLLRKEYGPKLDYPTLRKMRNDFVEEHMDKYGVKLKKGIKYMLDTLDGLGLKKCIATSTEWVAMERKLKGLDLIPRFDGIVAGDQVKNGKPHPEIFLKAADLIGIKPANCVVLEDSPAGITAAFAAGMRPIMIPDLVQPDEELQKKYYTKCKDLEEAAEVITKLSKH